MSRQHAERLDQRKDQHQHHHRRNHPHHPPRHAAHGEYRAESDSTLAINDEFALTATLDILEDLAQGQGPARSLLALGYAGWAAGQLESEIAENGWLMAEARADIVFGQDNTEKWRRALETIGVDPVMLSATGGRA